MMVLASGIFCIFHPAWMLKGESQLVDKQETLEKEGMGHDGTSASSISSQDGHVAVPLEHGVRG